MGNRLMKSLGIAWVIIGLFLMVAGQNLYYYEETEQTWYGSVITRPYSDTGHQMYYVGIALVIIAIIIFSVGVVLKPSIGDVLMAERFVDRHQGRLQAYREGTGPDAVENPWQE